MTSQASLKQQEGEGSSKMTRGRARRDLLLVLYLLGNALFLPDVLGQEEAQEVTEYYEDSADNDANDM